jgi:hypothetical protein
MRGCVEQAKRKEEPTASVELERALKEADLLLVRRTLFPE